MADIHTLNNNVEPKREHVRRIVLETSGATVVGLAHVAPVAESTLSERRKWLADGCHADMDYLERYDDVRSNPDRLLQGARSVIMAAFSFANPEAVSVLESNGNPIIAEYALGRDYHTEIKERLNSASKVLKDTFGGKTRVCVDTAPISERYWSRQAGLGFLGRNNYLIIPGHGSHFVLGTLLWTCETTDGYDTPCFTTCGTCRRCLDACPGAALDGSGRLDARRCLAYHTIESKQPMPDNVHPGLRLFGCDTCRRACPHEPVNPPHTNIKAFQARPEVLRLTYSDWEQMTQERFDELFGDTVIHRTGLPKLRDTLRHLTPRF